MAAPHCCELGSMFLIRGRTRCELCNAPASLHEGLTVACTRGMLLARGRPRPTRRDTHPVGTSNTPGVPTRLAHARQVRRRFTIWALRLGGRSLALADRPRNASMSPARDAPRGTEKRSQPCRLAGRDARAPFNRATSAKTVYVLGHTSWRPRAGLGR